jgi:hypothetical protein
MTHSNLMIETIKIGDLARASTQTESLANLNKSSEM